MERYQGRLDVEVWKVTRKREDGSMGEFVWLPDQEGRPSGLVRFTSRDAANTFVADLRERHGASLSATVEPDGTLENVLDRWTELVSASDDGAQLFEVIYLDLAPSTSDGPVEAAVLPLEQQPEPSDAALEAGTFVPATFVLEAEPVAGARAGQFDGFWELAFSEPEELASEIEPPTPQELRAFRSRWELSQKEAGALVGYSHRGWQNWENEDTDRPRWLRPALAALEVHLTRLERG